MFKDPASKLHWPCPSLADLHSQALTMGDNEFFGSFPSIHAVRNPLTIDELLSFSKQLTNVAFTMYWRDDQSTMHEVYVSPQLRCSWETVREGDGVFVGYPCKRVGRFFFLFVLQFTGL